PLAPIRATTVPFGTSRETPWRICSPPYPASTASSFSNELLLSEIRLDHPLVARNLLWSALGQHHPVVKHDDLVRQRHDCRHDVLDQQHRDASSADLLQQLD